MSTIHDKVTISDSVSFRVESGHLRISHQKKCQEILNKEVIENNDIIDFFISLHIVLEVSLNALFRHITSAAIKKELDEFTVLKNLDKISYIDKTILFIYNSTFEFDGKISEATEHHKIIGVMRDFAKLRNQLLHGHTISTISDQSGERHSELKESLNQEVLNEQIKKYELIVDGLAFYLRCLKTNITESGKENYIRTFLSKDFLETSN